ncbi:MAG TPA: phage tail sheath subtilisin-like domain-containing protein [Candidatus Angelobacter sp.]
MPVPLSYPGVYIEEIPSGVHTITGVATSITAFVGRAVTGPVNDPTLVNSFADFQRSFGGLDPLYPMSYAVQDFYNNGGAQALIVRVFKGAGDGLSKNADTGLHLEAPYPGKSFDNTTIVVDHAGIDADVAKAQGLTAGDLFNLTVQSPAGVAEKILNVSVKEGPRRVDRVLARESRLVRIHTKADGTPDPALPNAIPADTADPSNPPKLTGGADSDALDGAAVIGDEGNKTGMFALTKADLFNLLCIPPDTRDGAIDTSVYAKAIDLCSKRRAMFIVDPLPTWSDSKSVKLSDIPISGDLGRNAAVYFPRLVEPDLARKGQLSTFVPCGAVAGIIARTDAQRGVWKAPAGLDAGLNGVVKLAIDLNDAENGTLNQVGVNCLRSFGLSGRVVWGARTLRGADQLTDEYKYVPVRRTALFIEESLFRGTQWVVFEPNDEPLWAQIRLNVGAFMQDLFRQGAFQGTTPKQAYFVKCDSETTTPTDQNKGIVNILVGFAPLKPAEFVVIQIQQMAGQTAA